MGIASSLSMAANCMMAGYFVRAPQIDTAKPIARHSTNATTIVHGGFCVTSSQPMTRIRPELHQRNSRKALRVASYVRRRRRLNGEKYRFAPPRASSRPVQIPRSRGLRTFRLMCGQPTS